VDRAVISAFCRKPQTQLLLAFLASLAIIFWQTKGHWHQAPYADEVTYMSVAETLYDNGIYGDGTFTGVNEAKSKNGEGMFFAPLYPAFLNALMHLSPDFAQTAKCSVKHRKPVVIEEKCAPLNLGILIIAQSILMALGAACAFAAAYVLTNHRGAAWIAILFIFTGKDYAELTIVSMSESLLLPLFNFSMLAALIAWHKRTAPWTIACAIGFGLLCLARPSFLYMLICAVPFLMIFALKARQIRPVALLLLFSVLCASVIAPWVIRNGTKIGVWDISYGLAPFTFAQRAAYNDMTWTEWGVSFIYGLPSFGDNLAEDLFPEEYYKRFSYDDLDGFYQHGNRDLRADTLKEAGSYEAHFSYLLKHYLFAEPFKHVMVTFSLVWRGMWVGGKLALIALPALAVFLIVALQRKRWDFLLYGMAPVFMLGFHGFTSVNVARYNLVLLPVLGIVFAWTMIAAWRKWKTKDQTPLPGLEPLTKANAV